jgi:8-oxo-dGTP pyrophosphatase MutT (NUDIX family)
VISLNTKIIKILSDTLRPLSEDQNANAAVALVLTPVNSDLEILFVKRVKNPSDTWSGHIALPGGKRESGDRTLTDTVIREIAEETNIDLNRCKFLGVLRSMRSVPKPEMKILPFVILCKKKPEIKLNKEELEKFVWIPMKILVQNKKQVRFWSGELPAYVLGTTIIWGLTYRILETFFYTINSSFDQP